MAITVELPDHVFAELKALAARFEDPNDMSEVERDNFYEFYVYSEGKSQAYENGRDHGSAETAAWLLNELREIT